MTYSAAEFKGQDARISSPRSATERSKGKTAALRPGVASRQPGRAAAGGLQSYAVVAEDRVSLAQYLGEWEELADTALEANVFYEPWMLLPAIDAYGSDSKLLFVLVFVKEESDSGSRTVLGGLFPIERRRSYKPVPATIFSLWKHPHCYLCTPLLKAEHARVSLLAFLDWLTSDGNCGAFELKNVPGGGPFRTMLDECLYESGLCSLVTEDFERAFIRTAGNIEQYLQHTISGKGRRELKRKVNRLSEMGALKYEELNDGGDVGAWIEDFLQVEATGWKGTEHTALACNERDRSYFKLIASAAFDRQKLLLGALKLNNRTIAIQCGFFSGRGYFAFKSAFDEGYGHFSPGVLLLVEVISSVHRNDRMLWMDSCTSPDNFVANRLFSERRGIQSLLVATGRSGVVLISVTRVLRRLKSFRRSAPIGAAGTAPAPTKEVRA